MIGASFNSTKTPLHDLLGRGDGRNVHLPDLQRGWVWRLQLIEAATGKTIELELESFRAGVAAKAYDEWPQEWDAEELHEEAVSWPG
jgi:hypothetical protein